MDWHVQRTLRRGWQADGIERWRLAADLETGRPNLPAACSTLSNMFNSEQNNHPGPEVPVLLSYRAAVLLRVPITRFQNAAVRLFVVRLAVCQRLACDESRLFASNVRALSALKTTQHTRHRRQTYWTESHLPVFGRSAVSSGGRCDGAPAAADTLAR